MLIRVVGLRDRYCAVPGGTMLSMGGLVLMKKVRRGEEALYRWFCFFLYESFCDLNNVLIFIAMT